MGHAAGGLYPVCSSVEELAMIFAEKVVFGLLMKKASTSVISDE